MTPEAQKLLKAMCADAMAYRVRFTQGGQHCRDCVRAEPDREGSRVCPGHAEDAQTALAYADLSAELLADGHA